MISVMWKNDDKLIFTQTKEKKNMRKLHKECYNLLDARFNLYVLFYLHRIYDDDQNKEKKRKIRRKPKQKKISYTQKS